MVSATKCPAWDNTLLTVGEAKRNLRIQTIRCAPKSRRDETLSLYSVVPAGLRECVTFLARIHRFHLRLIKYRHCVTLPFIIIRI